MFVKFFAGPYEINEIRKELWIDLDQVIVFYEKIANSDGNDIDKHYSKLRGERYRYIRVELRSGRFIDLHISIEDFTEILYKYDPGRFEDFNKEETNA